MIHLPVAQGSQAWLDARRQYVTATEMPVLLGLSPWKSEAVLAEEKRTGEQEPPSIPMRLGSQLESFIAQLFEEATGRHLRRVEGLIVHESGILAASPDWEDDAGIVETKWTTSRSRFADGLPQDIEAQVQVQLGCMGRTEAEVAALAGDELLRFPVTFDPVLFGNLLAVAVDFRRRLDAGGPFAHNAASLKRAYPADNGAELVADAGLDAAARELAATRIQRKGLEGREEALESAIKERMGEFAMIRGQGWHATWRRTKDREETDWRSLATGLLTTIPEPDRAAIVGLHSSVRQGFRPFRLSMEDEKE